MPEPLVTNTRTVSEINEYYKIEFSQVFERIKSLEESRVQLGTLFATTNLTVLGLAFNLQRASLILVAALLLIIPLYVDGHARRALAIYYYRNLQLQIRFAPDDPEAYMRILPTSLAMQVRQVAEANTLDKRLAGLAGLHGWRKGSFRVLCHGWYLG
jgi:hypothetical protein